MVLMHDFQQAAVSINLFTFGSFCVCLLFASCQLNYAPLSSWFWCGFDNLIDQSNAIQDSLSFCFVYFKTGCSFSQVFLLSWLYDIISLSVFHRLQSVKSWEIPSSLAEFGLVLVFSQYWGCPSQPQRRHHLAHQCVWDETGENPRVN